MPVKCGLLVFKTVVRTFLWGIMKWLHTEMPSYSVSLHSLPSSPLCFTTRVIFAKCKSCSFLPPPSSHAYDFHQRPVPLGTNNQGSIMVRRGLSSDIVLLPYPYLFLTCSLPFTPLGHCNPSANSHLPVRTHSNETSSGKPCWKPIWVF